MKSAVWVIGRLLMDGVGSLRRLRAGCEHLGGEGSGRKRMEKSPHCMVYRHLLGPCASTSFQMQPLQHVLSSEIKISFVNCS